MVTVNWFKRGRPERRDGAIVFLGLVAALAPLTAQAGTITAEAMISATAAPLIDAAGTGTISREYTFDLRGDTGLRPNGTVRYGADIDAGAVNADARLSFAGSFDDRVSLSDAAQTRISVGVGDLNYSFGSAIGAKAYTKLDIWAVNVDIFGDVFGGATAFRFDPPEVTLIDEGFRLEKRATRTGFDNGVEAVATDSFAGAATPDLGEIGNAILGYFPVGVELDASLNAKAYTSLSLTDVTAILTARHDSGAVVSRAISLKSMSDLTLDLSLEGAWSIALEGLEIENRFAGRFALRPGGEAELRVGYDCGDPGTNGDNGAACVYDEAFGTAREVTLFRSDLTALDFGTSSVALGSITVAGEVPLPAGFSLILTALGGLALFRRRS